MKKVLWAVVLGMMISGQSLGQSLAAKADKGTLNGASYIILFPANWNSKLVMYSHGYDFVGTPRKQSDHPDFPTRMTPFLKRGFAVAASDFSIQGLAITEGINETEALRQHFVKTYGNPDTTFMVGHSMGGAVTIGIMENFGSGYNGGLPLCPLSSKPYLQCRKEYDLYATFNGLFPGIATPLKDIFDVANPKPARSFSEMMPRAQAVHKAIVAKDSVLGVAVARRFEMKFDDLAFALFFNENVLRDIAQKAKGNPFDNTNTVYSGFPDDVLVNEKAERLPATVNPNVVFGKYEPTGKIDKPIVLMHTLYDQLIPVSYAVRNYENMVNQQNTGSHLVIKYTNGPGHCAFTPEQTEVAFDALRSWSKKGIKPKPGFVK